MLTAGSETMWENGEVTIIFERVFLATHTEVSVVHLLPGRQQCEVPTEMTLFGRIGSSDRFTVARISCSPDVLLL